MGLTGVIGFYRGVLWLLRIRVGREFTAHEFAEGVDVTLRSGRRLLEVMRDHGLVEVAGSIDAGGRKPRRTYRSRIRWV
jgi:response regulator of citrate/malate metabolism